jgi:hypothetical protein
MLNAADLGRLRADLAAQYDLTAQKIVPGEVTDNGWAEVSSSSTTTPLACRTAEIRNDEAPAGLKMDRRRHLFLFAAHDAGLVEGDRLQLHDETWRVMSVRAESGPALELRAIIGQERASG